MAKKNPAKTKRPKSPLLAFNGRKVELRDLRLIGGTVHQAIGPLDVESLPKELAQRTNVSSGKGADGLDVVYLMHFTIKATASSGQDVLVFDARFALVYRFDSLDGIDDIAIQAFGQTTALFCVWPYWREFVQNMSGRMGLPPLRIPLMRPADMKFSPDKPLA